MKLRISASAAVLLGALAVVAPSQQKVAMDKGIPVAPSGLAKRPLPSLPMTFDTGEGQKIRVTAFARGLESPFSAQFLPDGSMLVTERPGRLRVIRNGVLDPKPITGTPASYWAIESGLPGAIHGYMDIALHPNFAQNHWLYLTYTKPLTADKRVLAMARMKLDGNSVSEVKDLIVFPSGGTARLAFGKDGTLFMSATGENPQDANTLGG